MEICVVIEKEMEKSKQLLCIYYLFLEMTDKKKLQSSKNDKSREFLSNCDISAKFYLHFKIIALEFLIMSI